MGLGQRIFQFRTAKNLSQGALADMVGVSRQSVSKWETDAAVPDLERLIKLSDVFGVTLDELIGREAAVREERARTDTVGADAVKTDSEKVAVEIAAAEATMPVKYSTLMQQKIIGYILLAVSLLGGLVLLLQKQPFLLLFLAVPLLICSVLCLCLQKRSGYWCLWVIWMEVAFLHMFDLAGASAEMSWLQVVLLAVIGVVAWQSFRKVTVTVSWQRTILLMGWGGYVLLFGWWCYAHRYEGIGAYRIELLPCYLLNSAMTVQVAGLFTYTMCYVRSGIEKRKR